jgi:hypothetical protein
MCLATDGKKGEVGGLLHHPQFQARATIAQSVAFGKTRNESGQPQLGVSMMMVTGPSL